MAGSKKSAADSFTCYFLQLVIFYRKLEMQNFTNLEYTTNREGKSMLVSTIFPKHIRDALMATAKLDDSKNRLYEIAKIEAQAQKGYPELFVR